MTKVEAKREFLELYPTGWFKTIASMHVLRPRARPKRPGHIFYLDTTARRETWNNFTDALCKEGRITAKQYDSWTHPWKD